MIASFLLLLTSVAAQDSVPSSTLLFRDPDLSIEQRVDDLLGRMTLLEKVKQLLYNAPAIERLGIPVYNWWSEALHGVARAGRATVFPQSIGLAATFDPELIRRVATAISDEARAKYHHSLRSGGTGIYEGLTFFSPNINIFRDPRWGRGMETYGEDPYLTGQMGIAFIRGMQGSDLRYFKTAATAKHFAVHSGPEPDRHVFDAVVSERDLRETYLPAFRDAVVHGRVASVMCAYNRFHGDPCCGSSSLLRQILRREWNFDGFVVSDCWAISDFFQFHKTSHDEPEAAATALLAGTDVECGVSFDSLLTAVDRGLVSESSIDQALRRALTVRFRLGMFDPPSRVPYASIETDVVDSPDHRKLALEATRRSIVLLKNERNALPLSKRLKHIAVIGPTADDVDVLLGNYNGTPAGPVTILQGIRNAVGTTARITYARGCEVAARTPVVVPVPAAALFTSSDASRAPGLAGEYFAGTSLSGSPRLIRTDDSIDFNWWQNAPAPSLPADSFSIRWTGVLVPPVSGTYDLGARMFGRFRLWLDDTLFTEFSDRHVVHTQTRSVELEAGRPYRIRLEFHDRRADASVQLVWSPPIGDAESEAVEAARGADAVIMVLGLTPRLEGEEMPVQVEGFSGGDRTSLGLPRPQEELLKKVVGTGKPVVLVLLNGSALSIEWASENIPAIVEAWYPGQAAGTAIADVLFGDVNPSGRLPVTVYRSVSQLPPFSDYRMAGRTYRYFTGEPLYPFGYGMSYTTFRYSDLRIPPSAGTGDTVTVTAVVENSGGRTGDEVAQLYVSNSQSSVPVPIRSLAGFQRITLSPGERRNVTFIMTPRQLSVVDEVGDRVQEPGSYQISIGGGQPGMMTGSQAEKTGVLSGMLTVTGRRLVINER